jgi:hypothetical protein
MPVLHSLLGGSDNQWLPQRMSPIFGRPSVSYTPHGDFIPHRSTFNSSNPLLFAACLSHVCIPGTWTTPADASCVTPRHGNSAAFATVLEHQLTLPTHGVVAENY